MGLAATETRVCMRHYFYIFFFDSIACGDYIIQCFFFGITENVKCDEIGWNSMENVSKGVKSGRDIYVFLSVINCEMRIQSTFDDEKRHELYDFATMFRFTEKKNLLLI